MKKLKLYHISDHYVRFLQEFERKISYNKNTRRPYCGVILLNQGINYFIPFSSPKEKYKKIRNSMDVEKVWGGECGILNLNNMIPVPETAMKIIDIEAIEDSKYQILLRKQAEYVRCNSQKIQDKAKKLYCLVMQQNPKNIYEERILQRCCNLQLLEQKMREYGE